MTVWHHLYFQDEETANRVARRLKGAYGTEVRKSGPTWLVRASHTLPQSTGALEATVEYLREIAVAEGGEYDGWEREVRAATDPIV